MPDPLDPSRTIIFKDTDWQDVLFREPVSHNHHLTVSGGSDKATFNVGVGYLNSQGIAITTDYKRYSLSLNGELKASDKLSFFGRALLSQSTDNNVPNINNVFARAITLLPTTKYRFEDGTLAPGQAWSEANPEYYLTNQENENMEDNVTLAVGGRWEILPGLSLEPQVSIFEKSEERYTFQPTFDDAILQERLLELAFEGKRWWDLIQFGKAIEMLPALQSNANPEHLLLFPISTAYP